MSSSRLTEGGLRWSDITVRKRRVLPGKNASPMNCIVRICMDERKGKG